MDSVNMEVVSKIGETVQSLADSLSVKTEHLWMILVKHAYISAISNGVVIFITLGIAMPSLYFFRYWWNAMKREEPNEKWSYDGEAPCIVLALVVTFVGILITGCCGIGIFERLCNPEYFAIQDILDSVKPE